MASPVGPPLKRPRVSQPTVKESDARSILRAAQEISFPWAQCMPEKISKWFNIISRAHNTLPEFIFVSALSTTACLMGPHTMISVRDTYSEPTNIFTVCMGQPGCGKSQAFRLSILDPLSEIGAPMSELLVDDYTRRGLFNHLLSHEGRALCAHEEMSALFDTIQKRQMELSGERQLFCRLYDAGKWTNITGYQKQEGKQQLDKVCLCIAGFLQPLPFIQRLYPSLMECNDGFVDRFLICSPKPKLLLEEEVEEWCDKLATQPLKSLSDVYRLICSWHENSTQHVYTFSMQAKEHYRLFSNEMTRLMNLQFEGVSEEVHGNYSKDKRTVIRLSGIIHVLYEAMTAFLEEKQDHTPLTEISQEEVQMAIILTEYFQAQRQAYNKVSDVAEAASSSQENLKLIIMLTKGAFVTPRSVIKNMTMKKRPQAQQIIDEMKSLEKLGVGVVKTASKTQTVYYKPLPTEDNRHCVLQIVGEESWSSYVKNFKETDTMYITASQHNRLILLSDDYEELETFGIVER